MTVRLTVTAVVALDRRFDEAGSIAVAAAQDLKDSVAGMRARRLRRERPWRLRAQVSGHRVPHELSKFLIGHDALSHCPVMS